MIRRALCLFFLLLASPLAAAPVQQLTTPGGLSLWLVEDHSLPVVALSFAWKGGLEGDPMDRQGRSYLAASMLLQGAGSDDANAFQKKLQDNSISLDIDAGRDVISGDLRALREVWPLAGAMLTAAVQSPRFEAAALERQKAQMLSALRGYQSDAGWLVTRLAYREIFKDHPYGKRTLGTEASIAALTSQDLKAWTSGLGRKNLVLSMTGDITAAEAMVSADAIFAALPESAAVPPVPDFTLAASGTWLLRHPGAQTEIMMLWPGLKRDDPQWYVAEVMNYIWGGGGFSSRLTDEIREKRGLTYGIGTGMVDYEKAGLYMLKASTRNEDAAKVLGLIAAEAKRIRENPVTAEEVEAAKDYLIGAYPLQLTSTQKVAAHYRELMRQRLPADEQEIRAQAIRAVTVEQVRAMAQRLLAAKPAVFLVGEPKDIKADFIFDKVD